MSANSYEIVSADEVAFIRMTSDATSLQIELNRLRKKPKTFICLNDDVDYSSASVTDLTRLRNVLNAFYSYHFPLQSPFELPDGQTNSKLYIDSYAQRNIHKRPSGRLNRNEKFTFDYISLLTCLLLPMALSTAVICTLFLLIRSTMKKVSIYLCTSFLLSTLFFVSFSFSTLHFLHMLTAFVSADLLHSSSHLTLWLLPHHIFDIQKYANTEQ